MKCFNHSEMDAVGICKACSKGLCKDCAVDVGNGLTCKGSCEKEVKAMNEIILRNKTVFQKTAKVFTKKVIITVIICGLSGGIFMFFGLMAWFSGNPKVDIVLPIVLCPLGFMLMIGALRGIIRKSVA